MPNIIKKLRTERAWSQEQLAEMAGLSVRTVQRAENGAPSGVETLKSLAAVFEVSLDTLREEQTQSQPKDSTPESQPEENQMQADATTPVNSDTDTNNAVNTNSSSLSSSIPASLKPIIRRSLGLLLIVAMLALINLVTAPQYLWVKWPALGISLAILSLWVGWLMQDNTLGEQSLEQKNTQQHTQEHFLTRNKTPQTLRQTIAVSVILMIAGLGVVVINLLSSPWQLWCLYPLTGIAITLAIIWVLFALREPS